MNSIEHVDSADVTFQALIRQRLDKDADLTAYTFLQSGDIHSAQSITYGQLCRNVIQLGEQLIEMGCSGQRVIVLIESGFEFIECFFACLWSGVVAVPMYPPRSASDFENFLTIWQDSGAKMFLVSDLIYQQALQLAPHIVNQPSLKWLKISELKADPSNETVLSSQAQSSSSHQVSLSKTREATAFIQYTSGTTSKPKGVVLSHQNLLFNQQMIQQAFQHDQETVVVGWLPLYHDMGLIGNIMQPFYLGCHCVLMSPIDFIKKPLRWLQAISHYRATTSGGPNFAYRLCAETIPAERAKDLDLSSWTLAFNGAEPINASVLEQFCQTFSPAGFDPVAFYPCYGLAEASLIVSGGDKNKHYQTLEVDAEQLMQNRVVEPSCQSGVAHPILTKILVSSGAALEGCDLIIVNLETHHPCGENEIGEIWIRGDNVASGYWSKPDLNATQFQQQPETEEHSPSGYFRTGDLGFVRSGALYVTGRLKDLMIIRGKNHYPQDIEETVQAAASELRSSGIAAFSVEALKESTSEEQLVVLAEVRTTEISQLSGYVGEELDLWMQSLNRRLKQAILIKHGLMPAEIVFLAPKSLPKTSSGKLQRRKAKALFMANKLSPVLV